MALFSFPNTSKLWDFWRTPEGFRAQGVGDRATWDDFEKESNIKLASLDAHLDTNSCAVSAAPRKKEH